MRDVTHRYRFKKTLLVALWGAALALVSPVRTEAMLRKQFVFERLTEEQGLSQASVNCIAQDHRGFMWFGTEGGLSRYDGKRFVDYGNDPTDSTSIASSFVLSLLVDRTGSIWVGTLAGLDKYDADLERFEHVELPSSGSTLEKRIKSIHQDAHDMLWIGTENGLVRLDPRTGDGIRYREDESNPNALCSDHVSSIAEDESGSLWLGHGRRGPLPSRPGRNEVHRPSSATRRSAERGAPGDQRHPRG